MRTRIAAMFLAIAMGSAAIQAAATIANYSDWWWNEQQSGHGLNIGQQGNVLFVSWFTYDETGAGMWLTMTAPLNGSTASGDWIRSTGPALGTTFDPSRVARNSVGSGTLTFSSLHNASLVWTVSGRTGTVALSRLTWASALPAGGVHSGRMRLEVKVCEGGVNLNLPITSTYTLAGNALTIVDDQRATGTRVCTMQGTLAPSGSYFKVENGTYTCIANASSGTWTGTLLVRPPFIIRDEVLLINGSTCEYHQTTVTGPSALQQ